MKWAKNPFKTLTSYDPYSCWQPEVHPTYLVSTQKWPRSSQKMAKTAKKSKKLTKKGVFLYN